MPAAFQVLMVAGMRDVLALTNATAAPDVIHGHQVVVHRFFMDPAAIVRMVHWLRTAHFLIAATARPTRTTLAHEAAAKVAW